MHDTENFNSLTQTPDPRYGPMIGLGGEVIVEAVTQDAWGNPTLTVRIDGIRQLENVCILLTSFGSASGDRPRAPTVGTRGVIFMPRRNTGNLRAFWLGALMLQVHGGLHCDDPKTAERLEPTGSALVRESSGNETSWLDNGDYSYAGDADPLRPKVRDADGNVVSSPVRKRFVRRLSDWARTYLARVKIGSDFVMFADLKRREVSAFLANTGIGLVDGVITLRTPTLRIGTRDAAMRPIALAPPTESTLKALAKELAFVKAEVRVTQDAYNQLKRDYDLFVASHFHSVSTAPGATGPATVPAAQTSTAINKGVSVNDLTTNKEVNILKISSAVILGE